MSEPLITITESAREYLRDLLEKQGSPGIGVRIFVERPGTPHAECCMAYCPPGEEEESDVRFDYEGFHAWIEGKSVRYLEDASIDYKKDSMGGQLTFKAPKSRVPDIGPDATLEERINHVLYAEINPSLAAHGGNVQLLELTDDNAAILEFGGGCQGCSAVDMTLKSGVEKTLKERIPELTAVRDKTDHSVRENAY
ncbi:MAG: Fe/S biogenesis protein NfuA, partial [Gammaproteobacteria bacterium HGW-Gammaproteobacteria-14]